MANWLNDLFEHGYCVPNKKGEMYISVSAVDFDIRCGVGGLTKLIRKYLNEYGFSIRKHGNTYIVKKVL